MKHPFLTTMRAAILSNTLLSATAVRAASSPALLSGIGGLVGGVTGGLIGGLTAPLQDKLNLIKSQLNGVGVVGSVLLSELGEIKPTATPTSLADVAAIVQKVGVAEPTALLESAVELVLNGIGPSNLATVLTQYSSGINSHTNVNTREPSSPIYPSASPEDAPYSFDEQALRSAIYIPPTFTWGAKPPVILAPATGTLGGFTYAPNLAKLLPQTDYADPVWLNIPNWLLDTVPNNSEFVAYAINYIASTTNRNVSIIGLSQGNLNTQWAFTFWPSTRDVVSDYIGISPDYHGTSVMNALCEGVLAVLGCTPSLNQQRFTSKFIETFRAKGGRSAYVPTTTIRSALDEIVRPQVGPDASGVLLDERGVGVTNVLYQEDCPVVGPALVNDHITPLFTAPLMALIKDALTHDGPADIGRIGQAEWERQCSRVVAEGLSVEDVVATLSIGPVTIASWYLYPDRVWTEPALPAYAL